MHWQLSERTLEIARRPLVMGILNVTPDSFSDGGQFLDKDSAVAHALNLCAEGADLIDVGGESTRPGAEPVDAADEISRVVPVITDLARQKILVSIDTHKALVAWASLEAGAEIVNDVTSLRDPGMLEVIRDSGAGLILMHMQGTPATMQQAPRYEDVVNDVAAFFEERLRFCAEKGIEESRLALDPGIGFGKTADHNLALLRRLEELGRFGRPVCLGASRKSFLGSLCGGREAGERLAGSLAVACLAALRQSAQILRVHDVKETRDALTVIDAIGSPG